MLPPWLSESEATESGYEAPVQNLPQQDLISEKSPRKRFGRKSEPDTGPSLGKSRKDKRKNKSDETPEQQPRGEPPAPSEAVQPWGEPRQPNITPQSWSAPPDDGERPNGDAPQPDPQLGRRPNGQPHPAAETPPFDDGFTQAGDGFGHSPQPHTGPQNIQGVPAPDQSGPVAPMPPGPNMPPQQWQPPPTPQVPQANRPPIPDAPQSFTEREPGDAANLTVRADRLPDLPPAPERASQRPPLPEPPSPGTETAGQSPTATPPSVPESEQGAADRVGVPESAAAQSGPEQRGPQQGGPEQAVDQRGPEHRGPDAGFAEQQPPVTGQQSGNWRAPESDPQVSGGHHTAPGPYPQQQGGPGPRTGQQTISQGEHPPQGFGPNGAAIDPRFAPPEPPPAQGGQWQSGPPLAGQGRPPQFQQPGPVRQQPPQYQQPGQFGGPQGPSLDDVPVRRAKKAPGTGWRRTVHHISGGAINPGMSAEERRLQELVVRIRQPVRGDYRIAVLSLKGGVGKTTTTMGIGSIFASIRGDRVIAVDANPDFGTLSQRVQLQTRSTVRDLLLDPMINSYGDVRRHTSQGTSRLEVLASERDPAASESFSDEEYRRVARILQRFYNIILTDCGTGLMHSAMTGVLELAHSLVLISSSAIDGARSAAATLDWLSLHGHDHLVRNAVVVINLPRPGSPNVGIQQLREYFLSRCRAVHIIPYDPHLSEGAEIELARLHKTTKRALVELSATVADDFATDHSRFQY
jgi:MinD-like ATPase involved in chromosome partitioning or flagellar assembly